MAELKNVIKVQKVERASSGFETAKILATLCYYYPQYTLQQARKLPYKHVKLMLDVALEQKNIDFIRLTQIAAAPHTKNGKGVGELLKLFKGQIDG